MDKRERQALVAECRASGMTAKAWCEVEMAKALVPPEKLVLGISAPTEKPESILTKVGIARRYGFDGITI